MANLWKDQIFNAACSALVVTVIFGLARGAESSQRAPSHHRFFVMPVVDNGPIIASLCLNVMEGC